MKKNLAVTFILVFFTLFAPQLVRAAGNTYYVSVTGNDSNSGTIEKPFRTIQKAANIVAAGDTVYVRGGTYKEKVTAKNSGTVDNYITFSAYPGETAIVDGSGIPLASDSGVIYILNKSYIKITNLKVINSAAMGIVVDTGNHIIIEKNHTYNTVSSGIGIRHVTNMIVDGNEVILACNDGDGEMISVASSAFVDITNNKVHHGGPGTVGGEGINVKNGSHDVLVQGNQIHHNSRVGIYVDAYLNHTYNVFIDRNSVYSNRSGIAVASEHGGELNDIFITNNLVYQNVRGGIMIGDWGIGHPHNIYIINNTVALNKNGGIALWDSGSTNIFVQNNILSQNSDFTIQATGLPLSETTITNNLLDGYRNLSTEVRGTNYIEAGAKFSDATNSDFHLLPTSPAIDTGTTVNAPAQDFANQTRDAHIDIGAYEYDPAYSYPFFTSTFNTNFSGWSKTRKVILYSGAPRIGARSIRLSGNASITRIIPTTGYENLTLTIYMGAKSYEGKEKLTLSWWNGALWQPLIVIKNSSPKENGKLNYLVFPLPSQAGNSSGFKLRIAQTGADLADYGYIDSVQLKGTQVP